jgi:hypothetical protein
MGAARQASKAIRVTWVIDVAVDCALGARTVAVCTVLGNGRRLPARRASRRAFPSQFWCFGKLRGECLQMTAAFDQVAMGLDRARLCCSPQSANRTQFASFSSRTARSIADSWPTSSKPSGHSAAARGALDRADDPRTPGHSRKLAMDLLNPKCHAPRRFQHAPSMLSLAFGPLFAAGKFHERLVSTPVDRGERPESHQPAVDASNRNPHPIVHGRYPRPIVQRDL